jgi:hypothetical protein
LHGKLRRNLLDQWRISAAGLRASAGLEKPFYDAIFNRMKGHHSQNAARAQDPFGGGKPLDQLIIFSVYRDTQSLKTAGRGVGLARLRPGQTPLNNPGQF